MDLKSVIASGNPLTKEPWAWVVVNSSGGKDSSVALWKTAEAVRAVFGAEQAQDMDLLRVSHQSLGHIEWPGTEGIVYAQAAHAGFPDHVVTSRYRNRNGETLTLLDYVLKRGMWPSSKQRFCTSEFKRGPGGRVLTRLHKRRSGPILQIFGFRAEESPARSKRSVFEINLRHSSEKRAVFDCLPIHPMKETEVWTTIRENSIPAHEAYKLGMPRLSCVFCIFMPKPVLARAAMLQPVLFEEYCEVEKKTGHKFRPDVSLCELKEEIAAGKYQLHDPLPGWKM